MQAVLLNSNVPLSKLVSGLTSNEPGTPVMRSTLQHIEVRNPAESPNSRKKVLSKLNVSLQ